ncbi:MAG TPA: hypothetical protein VE954_07055 [Oligoflexus sp.]|uniref:hypothetical protein n=1 Tax=Oligoflexus sp. TaxID=1971216 RepID=UPI002D3925E6|nr:hypothetical protein [Oligoflexus sp.]HYX32855.1 hypothetical protein [Oligoflexus sp.]
MAEDSVKMAASSGQMTSSGSEKKRERKRVWDVLDQSLPEAPVRKSKPTAIPQPQTVLVPEACEIRWRDIALQNSAELSHDLRDGHLALEGECGAHVPSRGYHGPVFSR